MRTAFALLVAVLLAGCGGEAQPAKSPDETSDPDAGADEVSMANPDGAAPPDPDTPPPGLAVALPLPANAVKIVLKGKKKAPLELKPDGTLTTGGKPAASLGRDGVIKDASAQHVLTVKGDKVVTPTGVTLATFTGETELTNLAGQKLILGDDGALTLNDSAVGKAEAVGDAKRAALVGVWYVLFPLPDKLKDAETRPSHRGKPTTRGRGKRR